MYQNSNEKWKWIGLIVLMGVVGFLVWQNQQGQVQNDWLLGLQQGGGSEQVEGTAGQVMAGLRKEQAAGVVPNPIQEVPQMAVHIAGAVQRPGVYFLDQGTRIVDLVKAAGGVTKKADLNQINLAQPLADGQKVLIPLQQVGQMGSQNTAGGSSWSGGSSHGGSRGVSPGSFTTNGSQKVNINSASKEELQSLSGVGPSRADAIILYRTDHGAFRKLEDLMKVSGIGPKTFEKLKERISLY